MGCVVDSLTDKSNTALQNFGVSQGAFIVERRKAVDAAKNNGLLDFPLANALVDQASALLEKTSTGLANLAVNEFVSQSVAGKIASMLGSTLAIITAVTSYSDLLKQSLFNMNVSALIKELNIRIMYYQMLRYHINRLLTVMIFLKNPTYKANRQKLILAHQFVLRALKDYINIQNTFRRNSSGRLNVAPLARSRYLLTDIFKSSDNASKTLQGDPGFANKLYGAIKKAPRTTTIQLMQEKFNQEVLQDKLYAMEDILWNLARMVQVLPVPLAGLAYTSGKLFSNTTFAGISARKFKPELAEQDIDAIKQAAGFNQTFTAIDAAKGLVPTNILIAQLLTGLLRYDTDYENFISTASSLMTAFAPVQTVLTDIEKEMQKSLDGEDPEFILAGKETLWVVKLDGLQLLKKTLLPEITIGASIATSLTNSQAIQMAILNYQNQSQIHDQIVKLLLRLFEATPLAPLNNRALQETVTLCTITRRQIDKALSLDLGLSGALSTQEFSSDPLFGELMKAFATLPSPGPEIATAITSGEITAITSSFASLVTLADDVNVMSDTLSGMLKKCADTDGRANDPTTDYMDEIIWARQDGGYNLVRGGVV